MNKVTKAQYDFAKQRIETLLVETDNNTPKNDPKNVELVIMSDIIIRYEEEHFPIGEMQFKDLLSAELEETGMNKSQLASMIGVSNSRISDYLSGRAEPTFQIFKKICKVLNINPAVALDI